MGYSIESTMADCYEGTTCLKNKLNIQDEAKLISLEKEITFVKAATLEHGFYKGNFDFTHYKAIHKYLFEDLYEWAGMIRNVDISKQGTRFVKAKDIESVATACFNRLKAENYFKNLPQEIFVEKLVDFYCTTNLLHPFREGNGRTQRAFISQLVRNADYQLDFSEIEMDELMFATVQSANGVTDYLTAIFKEKIKK